MENANQSVYRELHRTVETPEADTRTCGKVVGSVGILFNVCVIIILFVYGATAWSVVFSVIFWIFAVSFILSVLWIFGIVFNIWWFMVLALIFWITQFVYSIYLAVVYVLAIIAGGIGFGGGALIIFIFVLGLSAIGLSAVYFFYAVKSFVKITFMKKKSRLGVSYTVSSAEHPGQAEHYVFSEDTETV